MEYPEDMTNSIECALFHKQESSKGKWGPEDEAIFIIRAIEMMGYEIKPIERKTLN